jgi:hypothetical protein
MAEHPPWTLPTGLFCLGYTGSMAIGVPPPGPGDPACQTACTAWSRARCPAGHSHLLRRRSIPDSWKRFRLPRMAPAPVPVTPIGGGHAREGQQNPAALRSPVRTMAVLCRAWGVLDSAPTRGAAPRLGSEPTASGAPLARPSYVRGRLAVSWRVCPRPSACRAGDRSR